MNENNSINNTNATPTNSANDEHLTYDQYNGFNYVKNKLLEPSTNSFTKFNKNFTQNKYKSVSDSNIYLSSCSEPN